MSNPDQQTSIRHRAPVPRSSCPMALAVDMLGDRWTMLILREAFYGVRRYDDMRADLEAPRAMLTDRLNRLVENGLLERHPYQEPGKRTRNAYELTQAGRDLSLTLLALTQWGENHVSGPAPVQVVDADSGKRLRVALVDDDGNAVELKNSRLQLK